jgi:hypothetical protein
MLCSCPRCENRQNSSATSNVQDYLVFEIPRVFFNRALVSPRAHSVFQHFFVDVETWVRAKIVVVVFLGQINADFFVELPIYSGKNPMQTYCRTTGLMVLWSPFLLKLLQLVFDCLMCSLSQQSQSYYVLNRALELAGCFPFCQRSYVWARLVCSEEFVCYCSEPSCLFS